MTTTVAPGGSRRLVMTMAVVVALLCTAAAFEGMFGFGRDMLGWNLPIAIMFAGIFELAQLTVALLAREAVKDGRPAGTLLTITWMLAAASGVLAAWEELAAGHGLAAALFRILAPVLAAGLWHLVLLGDRHLAAGRTWAQMRAASRMHALFLTVEDAARAHETGKGIARAEARRRRARAVALKTVPPDQMRAHVADWTDSLTAVADAVTDVARLHLETNQRVAGITPDTLSGSDRYADKTVAAITAEVADITTDTDRTTPAPPEADTPALSAPATGPVSGPVPAAVSAAEARPATSAATATARVRADKVSRPRAAAAPVRGDKTARLAVLSDLLDTRPDATTADAMTALTDAGHGVTDRTARRLLSEARHADNKADTTTDNDSTMTGAARPDIALAEVN